MWSYYGSKSKIVHLYPKPKFDKIIEPFAGSARYALKYWEKDVLLIDKYEVVVSVWKWLQKCSEKDILGLPKLKQGDKISDFNLSSEESLFLGFCCAAGQIAPRGKVSAFGDFTKNRRNGVYKVIASHLHKIRHWQIEIGSYENIENQNATWFIDPPYQFGGQAYVKSSKDIDFCALGKWCKSREGQIIVCENTKADWLPFLPITKIQGVGNTDTTEAIYTNLPTSFGRVQTSIF